MNNWEKQLMCRTHKLTPWRIYVQIWVMRKTDDQWMKRWRIRLRVTTDTSSVKLLGRLQVIQILDRAIPFPESLRQIDLSWSRPIIHWAKNSFLNLFVLLDHIWAHIPMIRRDSLGAGIFFPKRPQTSNSDSRSLSQSCWNFLPFRIHA